MAKNDKLPDDSGGTTHIRIYEDLVDKIKWVARLKKTTAAKVLDPMIRPEIEAMYAAIEARVEQIKTLEGDPSTEPTKKPRKAK